MASKSGRYLRDKLGRFAGTAGGVGSTSKMWKNPASLDSAAKANDAAVKKLRQKRDALKASGAPKSKIRSIQNKINAQRFDAADRRERIRVLKAESQGKTLGNGMTSTKARLRLKNRK